MSDFDRYSRQVRFAPIGFEGQQRLRDARILVVGVGALGSASAEMLARAGVGALRLVDRDFVEASNLQRQSLYTESDAREGTPKAIAARERLQAINSTVELDAHVLDMTPQNAAGLLESVDLIIDGTDHFEIRFLLNDLSLNHNVPWIFGGCLRAEGQVMTILPGETPCLRCLLPDGPPSAGETCESAGVIGPIVQLIAAIQVSEALKVLTGNRAAVLPGLTVVSLWDNQFRQLETGGLRASERKCVACSERRFEWLNGERFSEATRLCGRNSVQVSPGDPRKLSLPDMAHALKGLGELTESPHFIRLALAGHRLTLFPDGRAIIEGTEDIGEAKSLYTKYFG